MTTKADGNRKPTAGYTATKGLGTSKAVLNTLKLVGDDEDLAFLKTSADAANGILSGIREIEDGEIDADFAALAMDACGLVYIVITRCEEILNHDGKIPDQTKVDSGGLTRNLEEIQSFVHKKSHRKLYQRILKHGSDEQKVQSYRDQLRSWQAKFGLNNESTIHESLQDIVDEILRKLDLEEHAARKAKGSLIRPDVCSVTVSPPPSIENPLPTILLSSPPEQEDPPQIAKPSNTVPQLQDNETDPGRIKEENEVRRKERLEEEHRRKKAERERWRKSEQEFIQLPEAKIEGVEIITPFLPIVNKPSSSQSSQSVANDAALKLPIAEDLHHPRPRPLPQIHNGVPKIPAAVGKEDKEIAKELHYRTQKELEAEDERQALLLAAKIQLEWEAEERLVKRSSLSSRQGMEKSPSIDSTQVPYPTYSSSDPLRLSRHPA
ncbi:hypothetical protein M413DRAFT_448008 [Hebeloma cylindrosporum]|uniref:Uncharacterized protein n=1 Tax=Hebeloma cylindrosporum TaxID=76867 RepID=A0A0C3C1X4_HEBCY|nr:hypothetical protein M413DRAFT_448008 [Hebeloma cylindrosporum h7]